MYQVPRVWFISLIPCFITFSFNLFHFPPFLYFPTMLENQRVKLTDLLSEELCRVAQEPWIHWPWIVHRHLDLPVQSVEALFAAYKHVFTVLDIEGVVAQLLPAEEDDGCRRCGSCCAELIPDPVTPGMVQEWNQTNNPLSGMYSPGDPHDPDCMLEGWNFAGERLRLCPFLLRDPAQGSAFCALHRLGPDQRPGACAAFEPSYPHCAVCYRPEVVRTEKVVRRQE